MTDFLIYDAKVAVLVIVFYMFYRLMLSRETFHRVNRVVLLLTAVASFVLPLCVITLHKTVTMAAVPVVGVGDIRMEAVAEAEPDVWQVLLPVLFIIGVAVSLGHTLLSIVKVWLLIQRSEKHPQPDGTILCVTGNAELSPFSWMRYIVMNRSDYEAHDAAILAHERGHIRLGHSWDLLLVDLLTALQWFNPAMWMLRTDLRAIHEYEADGEVLSQGINARQYQYLLISKAAGIGGYSIANGINHSTLKNRINMMLHKKSQGSHLLKLLALIPIVGLALALNARTVVDVVYTQPQKQITKKGIKDGTIKVGSQEIKVEQAATGTENVTVKIKVTAQSDGQPVVGAVARVAGAKLGSVSDKAGVVTMTVPVGSVVEVMYIGLGSSYIQVNDDQTTDFAVELASDEDVVEYTVVSTPDKVFDVVEEMPQYPGGASAMMEYLMKNIRYPKDAFDAGVQGRVIIQFVVGKDGSISDAHVEKGVSLSLDEEALRVINSMPNWIPGKQNGVAVAVKYTVPVTFLQSKPETGPVDNAEVKVRKMEGFTVSADETFFILDGEPITADQLKRIDVSTIDHMEVLKDKAAVELYGDKAKNGAVVITTKKK